MASWLQYIHEGIDIGGKRTTAGDVAQLLYPGTVPGSSNSDTDTVERRSQHTGSSNTDRWAAGLRYNTQVSWPHRINMDDTHNISMNQSVSQWINQHLHYFTASYTSIKSGTRSFSYGKCLYTTDVNFFFMQSIQISTWQYHLLWATSNLQMASRGGHF